MMSGSNLNELLEKLCESSDELWLSMVVSTDGLVLAHHGNVRDPDRFGAYFAELKVVCEKIIAQFDLEDIEEIYIRSKSGAVTLFPIFDKGYLACLSSASMNAGKVQIHAWQYIRKIHALML